MIDFHNNYRVTNTMEKLDESHLLKSPKTLLIESPTVAFLLALVAGSLNGYTYHKLKAFSTVQSGNIILLSDHFVEGDWESVIHIGLIILVFGLGVMSTIFIVFLEKKRQKFWAISVLACETMILCVIASGILSDYLTIAHICLIITFIAGMQGSAFHKVRGMFYGNISITPVLQQAFNCFIQAFLGNVHTLVKSGIFFYIVFGFGVGGSLGVIITASIGEKSLFLPAIVLCSLMLYLYYMHDEENSLIE